MLIQQDMSRATGGAFTLTPVPRSTSGSYSSSSSNGFVDYDIWAGSITWNDALLGGLNDSITIHNESPTQITINGNSIERLSGSGGSVRLENVIGVSKRIYVDFSYSGSSNAKIATGWTAGTHPALASALIIPKLDEVGATKGLFSSVNHSTGVYTASTTCWARGWDWTGVSVYSATSGDFRRPVTLITRRHGWCAHHYQPGSTVKFRNAAGTLFSYTVIATTSDGFTSLGTSKQWPVLLDGCMVLFDRSVDASIMSYEVADEWFDNIDSMEASNPEVVSNGYGYFKIKGGEPLEFREDWIGTNRTVSHLLMFADQSRDIYIAAYADMGSPGAEVTAIGQTIDGITLPIWLPLLQYAQLEYLRPSFLSDYSTFFKSLISGDSGGPFFYPTSASEMALVATAYTTAGSQRIIPSVANALIQVVDARGGVSTGLTVTAAPDPTL